MRLVYGSVKRVFVFLIDIFTKDYGIFGDEALFYNILVCFFFKGFIVYDYMEVENFYSMLFVIFLFVGWRE